MNAQKAKPDVWILSHTHYHQGERSSLSGPVRFLLDYFSSRASTVVLQEQPMPSSDDLVPTLKIYKNGVMIRSFRFPRRLLLWWMPTQPNPEKTYIRLKIRDLLSAAYFTAMALRFSRRARLFIGVECLNSLWGSALHLLGRADCVVYYLFDFSPMRYSCRIFNWLYLRLDRAATYSADATWNISAAIEEARLRLGYDPRKMSVQVTVPYGVEYIRGKANIEWTNEDLKLVFAGGINRENGVMLLPEILAGLKPFIPRGRLLVMGAGSLEKEFLRQIDQLGLSDRVDFRGYLNSDEVYRELLQGHIALAPYYPMESVKRYGDVIKIKTYLAAGLPVITTDVPPISREIREKLMGVVVPYEPDSWVQAILSLVGEREKYLEYRRHALEFMNDQYWETILDNAVAETMRGKNLRG